MSSPIDFCVEVAGFDFEFSSTPDQELLQRALLRWMQSASRDLGLKLRYRKKENGFYVSLDGPLPEMQALPTYCYSGLDAIAASFDTPPKRRDRQRVLARIRAAFEERLEDMVEAVNEVGRELKAKGFVGVPRSIDFDPGPKTHLKATLKAFQLTLIKSYTGISSRSLLEECHTVTEHLMNALLSPSERRNLSFEQKLDEMTRRKLFQLPGVKDEVVFGGAIVDQLKELKDCRRNAKHRGQMIDGDTANRLTDATVVGVHLLLAAIRDGSATRE